MAAPSYATDLTTMDESNTDTDWAEPTASGWTSLFSVEGGGETDDYIQNTACNSATVKTGVGGILYDNTTGITLNQDDAVLVWIKWDAAPLLATEASGGIRTIMGDALNAFYGFDHLGSDSYTYGGWRNLATGDPIDTELTPDYTVGSIGSPFTRQYHGWAYNAPTAVPSKGNPFKVDAIRYGRCEIRATDGDLGSGYATFDGMATENDYNDGTNGYNRWGLFQAIDGGYLWKGLMSLGTTATSPVASVDFRDSNKAISIDNTKHVTKNFNKIEINHASSRVDWTSITISALGTVSPGRLEVVDNADVNIDGCTFNDMDTFIFQSNSSVLDTFFVRCGQITHGGADMTGSSVSGYEGTAGTSALVYNVAADPDGEMDNMSFVKGTASTHAIEFGLTSPLTMTLRGCDFTGYGDGSPQDDAIFHFKRTSGTVTLNLVGCTTDSASFSYQTDGATIDLVEDPVTVQVTATKSDGVPIENARVLLLAVSSSPQGPFPVNASVTIARSGSPITDAIVTHTGHGLASNDKVAIDGAVQAEYNGVKTITVIDANSYSFPLTNSPLPVTPATGTITATFAAVYGLTNASGVVSTSRVYSANQAVSGWARKSTSSPLYQQGILTGEVDSSSGYNSTAVMISDE